MVIGKKTKRKPIRFKPLKQKPLPGAKKRRKVAKRAVKRIKKAFPLATKPLR